MKFLSKDSVCILTSKQLCMYSNNRILHDLYTLNSDTQVCKKPLDKTVQRNIYMNLSSKRFINELNR